MSMRKALGNIGYFIYQVKEGAKRALDTEGYDDTARENNLAEVERRDNERWHRVTRQCAIDQQERHDNQS